MFGWKKEFLWSVPLKKTLLLTIKNKQIYLEANNVETKSTLISIFFELSEGSTSMLSLYKEMKIDIKLFFLRFICIGTYKQNRTLFTLTLWVLYKSLTNFVSLISFCNSESIKKPLIFWCFQEVQTEAKSWLTTDVAKI